MTNNYLLFHIFNGAVDPTTGIYNSTLDPTTLPQLLETTVKTLEPATRAPRRLLGIDIGPIAPDQGPASATALILGAFQAALATGFAVSFHLDDRMFWKVAPTPNGPQLITVPGTREWADWNETSAGPLSIPWAAPDGVLAPQMCYEDFSVLDWTNYWLLNVIGPAIYAGYQFLVAAGHPELFAGVFCVWESNIGAAYRSLSLEGYSATNLPPGGFVAGVSRLLGGHISLWARLLTYVGIPMNRIYTHVVIPIVPDPSIAFTPYSIAGFTNYVGTTPGDFQGIYNLTAGRPWVLAECCNVVLGNPATGADSQPSPYNWESFLAKCYNHGAGVVTIQGAFQGETGAFTSSTGPEAVAAYQKWLSGGTLIDSSGMP